MAGETLEQMKLCDRYRVVEEISRSAASSFDPRRFETYPLVFDHREQKEPAA